jgi:hypothetical protein
MPRVRWDEQLCVSCEFVTINSRCTDFLRSTGEGHRTGSTVVGSEGPAVYTAVQVCGFGRLRVEESLGMERIPKLGLDFCQAVVVKRISPVNS